jgi:hypothetical protein
MAAQMVAMHLMKPSAQALRNPYGDPASAALATGLARTYAMRASGNAADLATGGV